MLFSIPPQRRDKFNNKNYEFVYFDNLILQQPYQQIIPLFYKLDDQGIQCFK